MSNTQVKDKLITLEELGAAYDSITPANIGAKPTQTAVVNPTASGTAVAFIDSIAQNANGVITPTKKTVRSASQSESGLMSATDKTKLDGIAAGAQVNSLTGVKGNAESSYRTGNVNLTPENIGAFKQIPGYVTREMLDDYNIKYWYGGRVTRPVAIAIGLPEHEWFVLNMSKDDDAASSWPRQVFYQLGGSMIFERTCSSHTWNPVTKVSIVDEYGSAATVAQETIVGARSFVLHSYGGTYPHVGAIFKETGLQLWDYNNISQLWWFPKEIGSAPPISLNLHDGSREAVLAEIYKIEPGYTAPIFITSAGCSFLTGGKRSLYLNGIIARTTPTSVMIMASEMSPATAIYTWSVDNLNADPWTIGAITQYTGTIVT